MKKANTCISTISSIIIISSEGSLLLNFTVVYTLALVLVMN